VNRSPLTPRSLSRCSILFLIILGFVTQLLVAQDFKKQVIYQIVTDRFFNGDTTNDNPPQSAGLFDSTQTNWHLYWGADISGIQQKAVEASLMLKYATTDGKQTAIR
jgi:hypothetical protein